MWSYRPLIWISTFLRCINLPNVNPFVDVKSQLISGETWSWPVGASSARAARSTRARSCRRTRSCTVQTASGVCRVRSHRSASLPILLFASVSQIRVLTSHYFLCCLSHSLRLYSSTSWWRSFPTTTTWRRRPKATARLWGTEDGDISLDLHLCHPVVFMIPLTLNMTITHSWFHHLWTRMTTSGFALSLSDQYLDYSSHCLDTKF